jgi:hypothetical protein
MPEELRKTMDETAKEGNLDAEASLAHQNIEVLLELARLSLGEFEPLGEMNGCGCVEEV